jgi:hypothetical protein
MKPILNLAALERAILQTDPFEFLIEPNAINSEAIDPLNQDYPEIDQPANYSIKNLPYGPTFAQLVNELNSAEFEDYIERKFSVNLQQTFKTITVRKFSEPSDGNIHTDHWSKVITVLIYFNKSWSQSGGKLRLLKSKNDIEDYAAEVNPMGGALIAFKRSDRSFHGYKAFEGERRILQINWVRNDMLARYAQQLARFGTHTAKQISRWF